MNQSHNDIPSSSILLSLSHEWVKEGDMLGYLLSLARTVYTVNIKVPSRKRIKFSCGKLLTKDEQDTIELLLWCSLYLNLIGRRRTKYKT